MERIIGTGGVCVLVAALGLLPMMEGESHAAGAAKRFVRHVWVILPKAKDYARFSHTDGTAQHGWVTQLPFPPPCEW
jgi:hypothetical protein